VHPLVRFYVAEQEDERWRGIVIWSKKKQGGEGIGVFSDGSWREKQRKDLRVTVACMDEFGSRGSSLVYPLYQNRGGIKKGKGGGASRMG